MTTATKKGKEAPLPVAPATQARWDANAKDQAASNALRPRFTQGSAAKGK